MTTTDTPRTQQHIGDVAGYWAEHIDAITQAESWDDDSPARTYELSDEDKRVILLALRRQFIAQKRDRVPVLHAYKAMASQ